MTITLTYNGHVYESKPFGYYKDGVRILQCYVPTYVMYRFGLEAVGEADL